MNKNILKELGFDKELKRIAGGNCPLCGKEIKGFKDALSRREYKISRMCQDCQEKTFKEKEE